MDLFITQKTDINNSDNYWVYTWDSEGNLRKIEKYEDGIVTFAEEYFYDDEGTRIRKVNGSVTTIYIYEGLELIYEKEIRTDGTKYKNYIYGLNTLQAVFEYDGVGENTGSSYHYCDIQNSTRFITDSLKNIVQENIFDPFGQELITAENSTGGSLDYKYATHSGVDKNTGLTYMTARWMDNVTGRFISPDVMKQGVNYYVYCGNNPTTMIDPDGNAYEIATIVVFSIIGSVIGGILGGFIGGEIYNKRVEDAGKSGGKIPSSWAVADTILGGFIGFNVGAIAGALIGVDIAFGGFGIGSAIGAGLLVGTITIAEYYDVMPNNFHIFGITPGEFSAGLDFKKRQDEYAIDLTQYYKSLEEIKQQNITYEDSDDSFEREKAGLINESVYLQDNIDKQKIESEKIEKEIKIIKDKYNNKLKVIELTDIGDEVVDFDTLMKRFTNREKDEYGLKYGTTEEPCKYIENGCYARAEIMAQELTKNGITTEFEYINIKGEGWNFHVVALVTLGNEKFYIDPALSDAPLEYYSKEIRGNELYKAIRENKKYGGTPTSLEIRDTNPYYDNLMIPNNKRLKWSRDIIDYIVNNIEKNNK